MKTYDTSLQGIEELSVHSVMPSNRYIDLSLPLSNIIVAPDDGYVYIVMTPSSDTSWVTIISSANFAVTSIAQYSNQAPRVFLPVSKDDSLEIRMLNSSQILLRFIYPNGSVPANP